MHGPTSSPVISHTKSGFTLLEMSEARIHSLVAQDGFHAIVDVF